ALGLTNQQDALAFGLEGKRRRLREVVQQPHAADRWRRQNAAAVCFVVERDIAGDDRKIQRGAGRCDALQAADELTHVLRPFRIAEVQVVGDRKRAAADGGDVAPGFRDRLLAAFKRISLAIAWRYIDRERETLRPVLHAHDSRIAAGALHSVAADNVI